MCVCSESPCVCWENNRFSVHVCFCVLVCVCVAASHFTLSYTNFHTLYVCVKVRKDKMPAEEDKPARWTKGRVSNSSEPLMSPKPDR